jgi:tetratricopeptide (TPR) repeat protein
MKNNILLGSVLPLIVFISTASHAATLDRPQIESSRVNWIAEREDDNLCNPKKRKPAKYYYDLSLVAIDPALKMYCLNRAIKADRKYINAYDRRGTLKRQNQDFTGAIADYSMAIKIDPKYGNAYYNRAVAKEDAKDKTGAIADYNLAITIFRQNKDEYELGVATEALEKLEKDLSQDKNK